MIKTIMVTGSEGFVGKNLIARLDSDTGHKVIRIDRKIGIGVEDITVDNLVGIDVIIHLANTSRIPRSWKEPEEYFQNNVNNSVSLYRKAQQAKVKRFFYVSSSSVYGSSLLDKTNEQSYCRPNNPYAISKLATEQCLGAYREIDPSTELVIIRPFTMYGPGQPLGENALVIGKFINCVLNNVPLTIEGSGLQKRDFLHVDDFSIAMLYLLNQDKTFGTYNVGFGANVSIKQIAEWFDHPVEHTDPRLGRDYDTCADISRLSSLGWGPSIRLKDWIEMTKSNNFKEFK